MTWKKRAVATRVKGMVRQKPKWVKSGINRSLKYIQPFSVFNDKKKFL
jgi:hypothetical protein